MPMRWEDERYVRLYTRKTADWVSWGWDGQALFCQLLMVADRAGIIDLGRHGKRGVALAIGQAETSERVLAALEVLLEDGVVVLTEDETELVIRNFVEAQEAKASDRVRKQQQRARDREAALSNTRRGGGQPLPPVTPRPKRSRKVTRGHEKSPRAVPSRAVPCSAEPPPPTEADPPPPSETARLWCFMQQARAEQRKLKDEELPPEEIDRVLQPLVEKLGTEGTFAAWCHYLENKAKDGYLENRSPAYPLHVFAKQFDRHEQALPPARPPCPICGEESAERSQGLCRSHFVAWWREFEQGRAPDVAKWVAEQLAEVAA